jgi:hypothetical protein
LQPCPHGQELLLTALHPSLLILSTCAARAHVKRIHGQELSEEHIRSSLQAMVRHSVSAASLKFRDCDADEVLPALSRLTGLTSLGFACCDLEEVPRLYPA